ncbi:MAG: hypothetical protein ABII82_10395 [Verrucomicrobiota bacterium]
MTNPDSSGKPTLEELLRLKRAERPQPEFWQQFDSELRRKQLAATIEPKPWWLGLTILSRKLAPVGLPVGAAAALTLAAVSYQTIGWAPAADDTNAPALAADLHLPAHPPAVAANPPSTPPAAETADVPSPMDGLAGEAPVMVAESAPVTEPTTANTAQSRELGVTVASLLPGVGLHRGDALQPAGNPTVSQRFIADNLAAAQKANPGLSLFPGIDLSLDRLMSGAVLAGVADTKAPSVAVEATADQPVPEMSPRNARLLALVKSAEDSEAAMVAANIAREQAGRLNDDILYASATRLGVGGDRLSIKF